MITIQQCYLGHLTLQFIQFIHQHLGADIVSPPFSPRSMLRRRSRQHELTPYRSIQSTPPCRRQAEIERAQIVFNRSQPGLPRSTGSVLPVFGSTPNAGLKSSRMVLTAWCRHEKGGQRKTGAIDDIPYIQFNCQYRYRPGLLCFSFTLLACKQLQTTLTFEVEKINSSSQPLEETHVDKDPSGVKLHVACVLGAVVGVVPFIGR